jgi:cytochrome c553
MDAAPMHRTSRALQQLVFAVLGCVPMLALAAPEVHSVPDTMAQRVLACTPCHGKAGVTTREGYFPPIAGKPAGYLYNQLLNFRDGRRHNAAMAKLIDNQSEAYLQEIAGHFASLQALYAKPTSSPARTAEFERGAQLVTQGDLTLRLPACTSCHGTAMTGVAPAIPGLLGLPRAYLGAQLGAWRTGQRQAQAPDCMGEISRRLTASDLNAVATYLSLQPVPQSAAPAMAAPAIWPMDCGARAR